MLVMTDLPGIEAGDIDEWYDKQHVPDRVPGVPGFCIGCRYVALDGATPRHMAYYETETPDVLRSPAYLDIVRNRDPLTDRNLSLFGNTVRTIGVLAAEQRFGFGSHRLVVPIAPSRSHREALRETITVRLLPDIAARRGIVRAALIERDDTVLMSSTEVHARKNDRSYEMVLLVDGTSDQTSVTEADLDLLRRAGGAPDTPRLFRLTMLAAASRNITA